MASMWTGTVHRVDKWLKGNGPKKVLSPHLKRPPYMNRHKGADFLVLGNGPVLAQCKHVLYEFIDRYRPIIMGGNHITPFIYPHYHAFTNRHRFIMYASTIDPNKSRVLLSPYLPRWIIRRSYKGPYETLMFRNNPDAPFDIQDGIIPTDCRSVSILLIGVAIIMGAGRIFVAGIQGFRRLLADSAPLHYVDTPTELVHDPQLSREYYLNRAEETARSLESVRQYMEKQGLEPFKIITPTDYEGHYQSLERLLAIR